jgi:cellulose synthase/poly-beta-1,6-N-acetylglucosamine synthase-like glycosyltransferase
MLFPVCLLVLLLFTSRYIAGRTFVAIRGASLDPVCSYEPTVSIVVPLYNEGRQIHDTILSLLGQDYPAHKLEVIVVDDCSTDDSYEWAMRAARGRSNVTVLRNPYNMGKRRGINHAVRESKAEIIVSVDSDVIVEPDAVRTLVTRFVRPNLAAVGGRVNVLNPHDNWLTRMQTIKYFIGYQYMKNLERSFSRVMCLSGCLTAYRRSVLMELEPILEDRNILGVPIKYGEDRYLTRQIVRAGYETAVTLDAVCWTVAPKKLQNYFSQQLRWRRSNIVDFFGGLHHIWKLPPPVVLHWLSLFAVLLAYPLVIWDNLNSGALWQLSAFHVGVLTIIGSVYWFETRHLPATRRVHPLWLLPAAVVMPVTYLLITPLALFTLDSGSWETRGAAPGAPAGTALAGTEATSEAGKQEVRYGT